MDDRSQPDNPRQARPWILIYSAAAVMMVIALGVLAWQAKMSRGQIGPKDVIRPSAVPAERYELLARFEPPNYIPDHDPRAIQDAMKHYAVRDYPQASADLRAVIANGSVDKVEAQFYLGVSLLLEGKHADGIAELRQVISAGNSPYLEKAHFYLAKGLLGARSIGEAQQQLEAVQAMRGDLERQAASLLQQIKP